MKRHRPPHYIPTRRLYGSNGKHDSLITLLVIIAMATIMFKTLFV